MKLFRSVVLSAALAALALGAAGESSAQTPDGSMAGRDAPVSGQSLRIRLQQAEFDPLLEVPALPPQLTWTGPSSGGVDYFIVQFEGPIRSDWRKRLEQIGAEVMDYVPDFAYLVRMAPNAVTAARQLAPVRWVGRYEPAFRLSNELIDALPDARAGFREALVVRLFPGEPVEQLTGELVSQGAQIARRHADTGGGVIFRLSVPQTAVVDLGRIRGVAWIEPEREPAYHNEVARSNAIMAKDQVETDLGLFGGNQIVAVGDTGLSTGNAATVHSDFSGRVVGGTWGPGGCGTWADNHSHGTHVAGSVLGSGFRSGADIPNQDYSGSNAGIAPEAGLYVWSFCNDFSGLPGAPYNDYYGVLRAVDTTLRTNTNSWGYTSGFGQYNTFTRETDRFVRDNEDMVILYSAGNSGTDANSNGVVDPGSIGMPGTAKNVITVGASENVRATNSFTWGAAWPSDFPANPINSDAVANNASGMAAFSSRGPTLSGRIKPDVVGPGTNIVSTRNESTGSGWGVYDTYYLYMGGTSMSTPLVAGASAIVREYFQTVHGTDPTAALVKGLLVNGAYDMTPGQYGAGATQDVTQRPDNNQGWGRVDLANSLIYSGNRTLWFEEHAGLGTGQSYQVSLDAIASATPLRFTLVWTDYQGTEASHGVLVNDLDLVVEDPNGIVHRGNQVLTGGSADRNNNIEGIDLAPIAGTYTMTIEGFNVPQGPQPFALVVSGDIQTGPVGTLDGLVDDGSNPLANATVTAVGPVTQSDLTDGAGNYSMTLPAGVYDVTASLSGHSPQTVSGVTVTDGGLTTQNFSLAVIPSATVTVCNTPNLAIPDGDPAGVDDAMAIGVSENILDVNVYLQGTHSWVGDLAFRLTHPNGSAQAMVVDRPGVPTSTYGCSGSNFDLWTDDEGTDGPVEDQCAGSPPALFGNPTPNDPLSVFDGLPANGSWTLNASDSVTPDPGTLVEWCLEITHAVTTPGPHTVTASVGGGSGTITPASQSVDHGNSASFTVTPDPGWSVDTVTGDTCTPIDAGGGSWTAANITADCAVTATFQINSYTVTAATGSGQGSITPSSQSVDHGNSASFTVTPDPGWSVDTVTGDTCTPIDAGGGSWTAANITAACAVEAGFVPQTDEVFEDRFEFSGP